MSSHQSKIVKSDEPVAENLRWSFLSDKDAQYIYERHPEVKPSFKDFCPTCMGSGTYFFNDRNNKCDCQLQLQLHKHYLNAGIGRTYQILGWDDLVYPEIKGFGKEYVKNHRRNIARGTGLIMIGKYGLGKTLCSNLILKDLIKLGYSCFGVTFTQMVQMFTAGWNDREEQQRFQEKVKQSQVLLIDDLGKEQKTKVNIAESMFDDVIRQRIQEGRPTILTSNKSMEDIDKEYGASVFSLMQESCILAEVGGDDFRPEANTRLREELLAGIIRPVV